MLLETLVHYSGSQQGDQAVKYAIIWLHGLGADNRNFLELVPYLSLKTSNLVKIIFPQAPDRVITANGYMSMPAWYDIRGWDFNANMIEPDFEGMQASIRQIHGLIEHERNQGILPEHIIVGGFSQGGVIGLLSALTYPVALSGAFGLSCYLPNLEAFQITLPLKTNQIFMAHGIRDQIVPYFMGEAAKKQLSSVMGATTEWHSYPIEHTINLEESNALGSWINTQLR